MNPMQFSIADLDRAIEAYKRGCGCVVSSTTDSWAEPIYTSNGVEIENARGELKNSRVASLRDWIINAGNYHYGSLFSFSYYTRCAVCAGGGFFLRKFRNSLKILLQIADNKLCEEKFYEKIWHNRTAHRRHNSLCTGQVL